MARSSDLEALIRAYEWLFAPPGSRPRSWDDDRARARLADAIDDERAAVLVADADGAVVGLCTAYIDFESVRFGRRCWVEDLAVDPGRRSRGIGAALLTAAQDWARASGATHLELDSGEARKAAHRFYEREGPSWRSVSYAWEL
jgi:GNAT superfamily N-acetyltransferase